MINAINCNVEGCPEKFQTQELVAPDARFTCRFHSKQTQIEASVPGRVYDPIKDEADATEHFDKYQFHKLDSFKHLRSVVDSNDALIDGSQIVKARNPEHNFHVPDFMYDNEKVEKFLRGLFPYYRDQKHRDHIRYNAYEGVIKLYFVGGHPDSFVETERNLNPGTCGRIVQDIRAVLEGKRRDGRPRSYGKAGRPKKIEEADTSEFAPTIVSLSEETAEVF